MSVIMTEVCAAFCITTAFQSHEVSKPYLVLIVAAKFGKAICCKFLVALCGFTLCMLDAFLCFLLFNFLRIEF